MRKENKTKTRSDFWHNECIITSFEGSRIKKKKEKKKKKKKKEKEKKKEKKDESKAAHCQKKTTKKPVAKEFNTNSN